jgi:hypothetical protein
MKADDFHQVIDRAVMKLGGSIIWGREGEGDQDFRLQSIESTHTLYLPYQPGDYQFLTHLGQLSGLPWIELRIQEGTLWDYALYQGNECIDLFSVCPQYWHGGQIDQDEFTRWQGRPELLAKVWGLPVEKVKNYLVNWGYQIVPDTGLFQFQLRGKAYPDDEYSYGEYEQFFDVLRTLGGIEPSQRHTLILAQYEDNNH